MADEKDAQTAAQRVRLREDEANARRARAKEFATRWQGKGEAEVGDKGSFWDELLAEVFGVMNPRSSGFIEYEKPVSSPTVTGDIDAYIPSTRVLIEQKSSKKKLSDRTLHNGIYKTPYQQAWDYGTALPEKPHWIVVCNFKEFWIWDTRHRDQGYTVVTLEKLEKQWEDLSFLTDASVTAITRREDLSVDAGNLVDALYDALKDCYPVAERELDKTAEALNVLCVRLVFCFYAESAHLFKKPNIFRDYLGLYPNKVRTTADYECLRSSLLDLFRALDMTDEERASDAQLHHLVRIADFPYVNGGLFTAAGDIPVFNEGVIAALEECERFNWEGINPTIFGAVFESTIGGKLRRSGGMHYTSIENIHKVIRPLFLDDLERELELLKAHNVAEEREECLAGFIGDLGHLTFLDPACGSGNFLTETYIQLCRLEGEAVEAIMETAVAPSLVYNGPSIDHFFGIEIDDFAASVAKTALWIADCQMKRKLRAMTHSDEGTFPIKTEARIFKGNALRLDWATMRYEDKTSAKEPLKTHAVKDKQLDLNFDVIDTDGSVESLEEMQREIQRRIDEAKRAKESLQPVAYPTFDYIMGNPPFVGHQYRTKGQADDMTVVFDDLPKHGKLDYVAAWYKKAADFMAGTKTKAAFVSTNSITQGESVGIMWSYMFNKKGVEIQFAYRTFRWDSESTEKAHVHCVIIGFTCFKDKSPKALYEGERSQLVEHINGYLVAASDVYIQSRGKQLTSGLPEMIKGSQPTDGGHLILSEEERADLIKHYPKAEHLIRQYMGAEEFINHTVRYCLWLKGVSPSEYRKIKPIKDRLEKVREFRETSPTESVREDDAKTPALFTQIRQPDSNYIVIPETSSEKRKYVPMGFMTPDIICSNALRLIPKATHYHFGVLTSSAHMAWMRAVAGRLKSDYRYAPAIYNNFIWPDATDEQKAHIEATAQAILDARKQFPDSSLAALYDEVTMPKELRKAHTANDRAVLAAYGWDEDTAEADIVSHLMELYQQKAGC